jgi:WD40 repeat protein
LNEIYSLSPTQVNSIASNSCLPILYTGYEDGNIRLLDLRQPGKFEVKIENNYISNTFNAHGDGVTSINLINDMYIISTSHDGSVKLWDIRTLNCLHSIQVIPE